ncbi:inner centromere protein, ARK binding region [Cooperia oncophora]
MKPKRSKRKPTIAKADCGRKVSKNDHEVAEENNHVDHKILFHPALKLQQIVERGCSPAMVDLQATFSNASDWLHTQKAALKELIKESNGSKAVPRTPRRGQTFRELRETVESYGRSILTFDDDDNEVIEHRGEGDTAPANSNAQADELICSSVMVVNEKCLAEQTETPAEVGPTSTGRGNAVVAEPESSYEDAVCSINREEAYGTERVDELQNEEPQPADDRLETSEIYTSATEVPSLGLPTSTLKVEVQTPEVHISSIPASSQSNAVGTFTTNLLVKQEILSAQRTQPSLDTPCTTSTETCERVTRSVTRANAAMNAVPVSSTRARIMAAVKHRKQTPVSSARRAGQEDPDSAAESASPSRALRPVHQHIVTTPCKREYKSAVQRVMDTQAIARNLSPRRPMAHTPVRPTRSAHTQAATVVTNILTAKRSKAEALRREKEELAAQLREEQCKERAERIRKEREEKALRAQRRREQKEAEEKQKAEARKRKEELDERRREELRIQKSPSRSKAPSRVVSPARAPKKAADNEVRPAAKMLFPTTPGRAPSKVAKVMATGGETSREPTMNTPTREARRKPRSAKKGPRGDDTTDDESISPQGMLKRHEIAREERQRIMREEHERQERLREEEKRRQRLDSELRQRQLTSSAYVKMEVDEVQDHEEEQRAASEERERQRLLQEEKQREKRLMEEKMERERLRIKQELREREEREAFEREQELERQRLLEMQQKEAERLREEQAKRVAEEEKRLLEAAEEEERLRRLREEEEEAMKRLNISCSAELHNRHLENVSLNTPAQLSTSRRHSSYELTPDKVFKPSSENNYNIEDLSSGDETDQEDAPRKKVPAWAEGALLRKALAEQAEILRSGKFDPDDFFGEIFPPDLSKIFGTSKRYPRRGSSGIWDSPISKPRQGVGAYQKKFYPKS